MTPRLDDQETEALRRRAELEGRCHDKAASLSHSIARDHPLVDGSKGLALPTTIAFDGRNGFRLPASNNRAYDLVMAVAAGELDEVEPIAERLRSHTAPWA